MCEPRHYFSLRGKQSESSEPDLELHVRESGKNKWEIELRNLHYDLKKRKYKLRFFWFCTAYSIYVSFILLKRYSSLIDVHVLCSAGVFAAVSLYLLMSALNLVRSETVACVQSNALQIETVRSLSRRICFTLPIENIHDIVLNEVIEDLDIRYILIVRTKGDLFNKSPIIPLFQHLKPSVNCFHDIYSLINQCLLKNKGDVKH